MVLPPVKSFFIQPMVSSVAARPISTQLDHAVTPCSVRLTVTLHDPTVWSLGSWYRGFALFTLLKMLMSPVDGRRRIARPQSLRLGRFVQGRYLELGMHLYVPERFATFGRSCDRLPCSNMPIADTLNWFRVLVWGMLEAQEKGEMNVANSTRRRVLYDIAQCVVNKCSYWELGWIEKLVSLGRELPWSILIDRRMSVSWAICPSILPQSADWREWEMVVGIVCTTGSFLYLRLIDPRPII